jgi:hypothetical protein
VSPYLVITSPSGGSRRDFALDAAAEFSIRRVQVVAGLEVDPKLRRGAKIAGQTKCGVRGNATTAEHRALEDTIGRAHHYGAIARDALALFPDSPMKAALAETVDFCIARTH